ncbi:serpin (serine protease inhibitor) domain-containing protein [Phthorimaea operculella]|nr:serpin (serine protease inhibitor) domain-containing protein [Phthorimaea operculella]
MFKTIITATLLSIAVSAPTDSGLDFKLINKFALKLLDNTYAFQEVFGNSNIAISPLSVWSVFSLLAEGSAGDTFQELMMTLQLPADQRSTQALHAAVKSILKSDSPDVTFKGQSAMFTDKSLQIHQEFCQSAMAYDTEVYLVDPSNTTKLANDINFYVCMATEGRITKAVEASLLDNLRMILVDALYFKAPWTHPFDPTQTKQESFYNSQGKTIGEVNMMYHKAPHSVGDAVSIGAQVLEMTYGKDEQFSMLILLPFDGMPIKKLLENLANNNLDWITEFKIEGNLPQIDVYVPRMKISVRTDLIPPLKYTGIHSIFDVQKAQLPGVSDSPLFVSKTIQNVEIEVNEEGTVAAAATVVGLEDRILGQRFEANKEFVFMIVERKSNVILFEGVYSAPSVV